MSQPMQTSQLISYQREEMERAKKRMEDACKGARMRPDTMYYHINMQRQVLLGLERLAEKEAAERSAAE